MAGPEDKAGKVIDAAIEAAGWVVQDAGAANLGAARGVAVRNFPLAPGFGFADYLLYVDGKAAGVVEAKKVGATPTGVEVQSARYSEGLPAGLPAHVRPLPFLYESTGVETRFTNGLDPEPRSRAVFRFHRPDTLADWLAADQPFRQVADARPPPREDRPSTLRSRLQAMPSVDERGLWRAQLRAVRNLDRSLHDDRPRALIQMATGSGKTIAAIASAYRLIKFADARRVLFLVDRANLGRQALKEFQSFTTPDDGRKFTELYNVQHLTSNKVDPLRSRRLRRLLPRREPPPPRGHVVGDEPGRPLARLRLRGSRRPRQVQPRRLLAQGREPRRRREPARPRRHRRGDRGGPAHGAGAVRGDRGGSIRATPLT